MRDGTLLATATGKLTLHTVVCSLPSEKQLTIRQTAGTKILRRFTRVIRKHETVEIDLVCPHTNKQKTHKAHKN